ncbi:MAG: flavodoxin family protein [Akkermansia sp.]
MSTSIIYSTVTGNTKLLAERIQAKLGQDIYCGKPTEEALASDTLYIGFWSMKFACSPDIQKILEGLEGKKIFLFGSGGFGVGAEFGETVLNNVKAFIKPSNEIIGTFFCQGEVSEAKKKALREMSEEIYQTLLPAIEQAVKHPDEADFLALEQVL